jgi:NAD(P)-dependent dehydrogenase (short-subunit alcohol dehydrogenase family)
MERLNARVPAIGVGGTGVGGNLFIFDQLWIGLNRGYSASKGGVSMLGKSLAAEWADGTGMS